jgi:hypothetical protein
VEKNYATSGTNYFNWQWIAQQLQALTDLILGLETKTEILDAKCSQQYSKVTAESYDTFKAKNWLVHLCCTNWTIPLLPFPMTLTMSMSAKLNWLSEGVIGGG